MIPADTVNTYGLIASRICLASVFLYSGADKLRHWRESIEEVNALGLPLPAAFATLTILTQLAGGIAVASGFMAAAGALLLAGFTITATVLGHRFWLMHGSVARKEFTTSLEHLAIVGGLCLIALHSLTMGG